MTGETESLIEADSFYQTIAFPLSMTTFLAEKVHHAGTRALLSDMRKPHSHLVAAVGEKGVHIFD